MWDFQDQYDGICLGWIHVSKLHLSFEHMEPGPRALPGFVFCGVQLQPLLL